MTKNKTASANYIKNMVFGWMKTKRLALNMTVPSMDYINQAVELVVQLL